MKQLFLILIIASAVIIAGCRQTSVAGVASSEEEAAWEATIRSSYPGYRPPRNAAPAEFDNTSVRRSAVIKKSSAEESAAAPVSAVDAKTAVQPAEEADPMTVVDKAAEVTSAPEAPKADVKAEAPKADVKAEAPKADAKAEAPKADVKAEAPKAEVKEDAPKADEKAEAPKADAKAEAPKAEVKADAAEPSEPTSSTVYVVKSGDTLGGIAQHFYGSSRYFEVITRANADLIKNPNMLRPGMKLIIPKL